ncbi:MAG: hypothetical protein AAGI46_03010 [Planctomycetota bacterium]
MQGVTVSPDGLVLAVVTAHGQHAWAKPTVTLGSMSDGRRIGWFPLDAGVVAWRSLFSPDGSRLFVFRGDTRVHVFDVANRKEVEDSQLQPGAGNLHV